MSKGVKKENIIDAADSQHQVIGAKAESSEGFSTNPHPEAQWFAGGGNLGLFVHFGISTVSSRVDLFWGMMANKPWETNIGYDNTVTPAEYFKWAQEFKPDKYNPERWIKEIAEAQGV